MTEAILVSKYKKTTIPKALKIAVWNKYIGEEIGKSKCLCCNLTDITQMKFHTGHIIAEACGGLTNIDNLKPICESCNKSMKTKNMDEFQKQLISIDRIEVNIGLSKEKILKNTILNEYNNVVKMINDKYNLVIRKDGHQALTDKFIQHINNISGNKQSDINIKFYEKIIKDGINGKRLNDENFNKLKNNNIKLYHYLAQIDETTLLDLINTYYIIY